MNCKDLEEDNSCIVTIRIIKLDGEETMVNVEAIIITLGYKD